VPRDLIGVLDVGKTHAKLLLVAVDSGEITWSVETRTTAIVGSATRELPVDTTERWILTSLASAPEKRHIRALVPVAHGAAAVLVSSAGEALAAPDYEDPVFETVSEPYRAIRDPFESTLSPFLPAGLNLGRQLYYLERRQPSVWRSAAAILLYPQYWAWRLGAEMASEITSLGCHSDLWLPRAGQFSALARTRHWDTLLPPIRDARESLGHLSDPIVRLTGLDRSCRVLCGIHDSNASYLCHRIERQEAEHFAVISSGTWTVIMVHNGDLTQLREDRDMLANVDAFGRPVATARFMGGREFEAIAGNSAAAMHPCTQSLERVVKGRFFATPSPTQITPPRLTWAGLPLQSQALNTQEHGALAILYCALRADLLLDLLGNAGNVIVDGPLSSNPLYGPLLAALRPGSVVLLGGDRAGSALCARHLSGYPAMAQLHAATPLECAELNEYREQWRMLVDSHGKSASA
jgi:sugar (pentulose or hexulose) kinase